MEVKRKAARLLVKPGMAARRIGTLWNSCLWDFMPQALSRVSGARCIFSVATHAVAGQLTVVDETESQAPRCRRYGYALATNTTALTTSDSGINPP